MEGGEVVGEVGTRPEPARAVGGGRVAGRGGSGRVWRGRGPGSGQGVRVLFQSGAGAAVADKAENIQQEQPLWCPY